MKVTEVLTKDELRYFTTRSDRAGALTVALNWASIAAIFAMMALWPNPLTILLGIILFGGRHLGLAVLMHDSAHRSLFKSDGANRFVGHWLAGAPVWIDLDEYWKNHSKHHLDAGTPDDPDLYKYRDYAIPRERMARKIVRDLTGVTAYRTLRGNYRRRGWKAFVRPAIANFLIWLALFACGQGWLFMVWIAAYATTYQLIARMRNAAEHAVVPDLNDPDPRKHTRTTLARWWERLTFAPNRVNYHLEHHLLPSVPMHLLRELHETLAQRGFYAEADIAPGYADVFKRLTLPSGPEA